MTLYRTLAPRRRNQTSPRKAARERLMREARRREDVAALPAAPSKLQQLEALVQAGRVADPLAGIDGETIGSGFRVRPAPPVGRGRTPRNDKEGAAADPHPAACGRHPPPFRGRDKAPSLTERVRALYESSVLPVREIARLAQVSERTLYKYVARYGWRRRHVCLDREDAVRRANRGRHLAPQPGRERVTGAGGRFVAHDEKSGPSGLKALDPLAAEAISAQAERVEILSDVVVAETLADAERRAAARRRMDEFESIARKLSSLTQALRYLKGMEKHDSERASARAKAPAGNVVARQNHIAALVQELTRRVEGLVAAEER